MSSPKEYDDDRELGQYVCLHFSKFLTPLEELVEWEIFAQGKRNAGNNAVGRIIKERRSLNDDAAVQKELANGIEAFRQKVCRRIFADHGDEVIINRCPKCHRIVRTPTAKQCFRCGHDWHDSAK